MRRFLLGGLFAPLFAAASAASSCGTNEPQFPATSTTTSSMPPEDAGADAAPAECAAGQARGPDGACMPVGVQGCAAAFAGADGLCHPRAAMCAGATIPKLDEGCVPVGVPMCASEFVGADGHCHAGMSACSPGTFAVPQQGCVPLAGPSGCGAGTWGNIPDAPGNVYVDPNAPLGGNGSKASPFKTIAAALAAVAAGGRVALAAGTYDEPVVIQKGIDLAGRCASMVAIRGTAPSSYPTPAIVQMSGVTGASIHDVTLSGDGIGLLVSGSHADVHDVAIDGATAIGVAADGDTTQLSLTRVFVRGTLPQPGTGQLGGGLLAQLGAAVTLADSALVDNRTFGCMVRDTGSSLSATSVLVEGTKPEIATGGFGYGFDVEDAQLTVSASVVTGNRTIGVMTEGLGATLDVDDSVIVGTLAPVGRGIVVQYGATGTVSRTAILDNAAAGLFAAASGTSVDAGDILVRGSKSEGGVGFQDGAAGKLTGSALVGNHVTGLSFHSPGAALSADGTLVEGTLPGTTGDYGRGVDVGYGAAPTLTSSAVVDNDEGGVVIDGKGSALTANAVLIEGNGTGGGFGVLLQNGGTASFDGSAILANHTTSVFVLGSWTAMDEGAHAAFTGSLVQGTIPPASNDEIGYYGAGVVALMGGGLTLASSVVRDHRAAAVLVAGSTAEVHGCLLEEIASGVLRPNDTLLIPDAADCLLAHDATITVTGTTARGCARAGFLFDQASGVISASSATACGYGLVLQSMPRPTVVEDCVFEKNTLLDRFLDGDLAVPTAPAPLPP